MWASQVNQSRREREKQCISLLHFCCVPASVWVLVHPVPPPAPWREPRTFGSRVFPVVWFTRSVLERNAWRRYLAFLRTSHACEYSGLFVGAFLCPHTERNLAINYSKNLDSEDYQGEIVAMCFRPWQQTCPTLHIATPKVYCIAESGCYDCAWASGAWRAMWLGLPGTESASSIVVSTLSLPSSKCTFYQPS